MTDPSDTPIIRLMQCIMNAFAIGLEEKTEWPSSELPAKLDKAIVDGSRIYETLQYNGDVQCSIH